MNRVVLIGRLTRDPELRVGSGEDAATVCRFSLAVDRRTKDADADFLNIVAFGKTAEVCGKYLTKGRQVGIDGRIQTRSYENKEGKKVNVFEIVAEAIDFVGSKQDNKAPEATKKKEQDFTVETEHDDDLPF